MKRALKQAVIIVSCAASGHAQGAENVVRITDSIKQGSSSCGTSTMNQSDLEARGKALRQDIDAKYRELEAPGGEFYAPDGNFYLPNTKQAELARTVNVTDMVLKYIPVGMSFDQVAVILRSAGLNPEPMGPGTEWNKRTGIPEKNAGLHGGISLVADMRWFAGFGISVLADGPDGKCASKITSYFSKQVH